MSVGATSYLMNEIKVRYLAYDYESYKFIELHEVVVSPVGSSNQYLKLNYLSGSPSALDPTHEYFLNAVLSGYQDMTLTGIPSLYINTIYYNENAYLLNIQF